MLKPLYFIVECEAECSIAFHNLRDQRPASKHQTCKVCGLFYHLTFIAAAILLSFWEISVNDGLLAGSGAQQLSIKDFHSGSHHVGIWGRNVLFTIPPTSNMQLSTTTALAIIRSLNSNFQQNVARKYQIPYFYRVNQFYWYSQSNQTKVYVHQGKERVYFIQWQCIKMAQGVQSSPSLVMKNPVAQACCFFVFYSCQHDRWSFLCCYCCWPCSTEMKRIPRDFEPLIKVVILCLELWITKFRERRRDWRMANGKEEEGETLFSWLKNKRKKKGAIPFQVWKNLVYKKWKDNNPFTNSLSSSSPTILVINKTRESMSSLSLLLPPYQKLEI